MGTYTAEAIRAKTADRQPDFDNLLKVLRREIPPRFTLFEFFLNGELEKDLVGPELAQQCDNGELTWDALRFKAWLHAGYDYVTKICLPIQFPAGEHAQKHTRSANDGVVIHDRATFDAYAWPEPENLDPAPYLEQVKDLPEGMKIIAHGPGGVLENATNLIGYENMCFLIADEDELIEQVFNEVGARLLKYYELAVEFDSVGAIISNDDWGFKTQTMISPADMRKYVFPWHKKIVAAAHKAGKPAILHSCGQMVEVWGDIIDDIQFDGKHSYEDNIVPVEESYERWGERVAILGGIDLDYVCRKSPGEVYQRSRAMLENASARGGYALGTGNSVPAYVPFANYYAMIGAVLD